MSRVPVDICDGCGDYGRDVEMTPVTIGDRRRDACPSCCAKVERVLTPEPEQPLPLNPMTQGPSAYYPGGVDRRNGGGG